MPHFARLLELGPIHGPLAAISRVTRSTRLEASILRASGLRRVRSRYGVTMTSNWSDTTFNMCYFAHYGRFLAGLLQDENMPFVFLDIGANQGLYSLLAGRNRRCRAAIAFEPVPDTFALLEANIAANRLGGIVSAVNVAVAAEQGSATIRIDPMHSGGASIAASNDVDGAHVTIRMLDHDGLDALIPPGDEVIIVKIDVEGFEPVVVDQLVRSRHAARIGTIFYEVDEGWIDPAAIETQLRSIGFSEFRRIDGFQPTHYDVLARR